MGTHTPWTATWFGLPRPAGTTGQTSGPGVRRPARVFAQSAWGHAATAGGAAAVLTHGLLAPMIAPPYAVPLGTLCSRWVALWGTGHLVALMGQAVGRWAWRQHFARWHAEQATDSANRQAERNAQDLQAPVVPGLRPMGQFRTSPGRSHAPMGADALLGAPTAPADAAPLEPTAPHAPPMVPAPRHRLPTRPHDTHAAEDPSMHPPAAPTDGRIVRTALDDAPQPEEVRDALALLFNTPYEHLYMTALSLHSGSSPEDLHAMGAAYVIARKRLEAGAARELLAPVAALPPYGSYFDHDVGRPRGIDLTRN